MAAEDEVRQASEQFYAALNSTLDGDSSPMEEIYRRRSEESKGLLGSPVCYGRFLLCDRSTWKVNSRKFALLVLRAESIRLSKNYCI
jgi:hypothetical protein